jgi:heat shock protein HslJ
MKKVSVVLSCLILSLLAIAFTSCADGASVRANEPDSGAVFGDVEGNEWILLEVKSGKKTIPMDRKKLEADGMGGVYTINFKDGRVYGMGAPNRYFGPYTLGSNRSLSIGNLATTLMASIKNPPGLNEIEYYAYLSKVTRWDLRYGKLELYSGADAVLIFNKL